MLPVWAVWVPRSSLNFACPENKENGHTNCKKRYQDWLTGILCLPFSISPSCSPGGLIKQPLRNGRTEQRLTAIRAGLTKDPLRSRGRIEPPRNQQLAPPLQAIVHIPPHIQAVPSFRNILFASYFLEVLSPGSSVQETNFHGVGHS